MEDHIHGLGHDRLGMIMVDSIIIVCMTLLKRSLLVGQSWAENSSVLYFSEIPEFTRKLLRRVYAEYFSVTNNNS